MAPGPCREERSLHGRAGGAAALAAAGGDQDGRPQEWIKNVFVFAGLLFSGKFDQSHEVFAAVLTFFAFCLISSAGYFVNDLIDVELDRKHPKKRFRPLAAGGLLGAAKAIAPALALVRSRSPLPRSTGRSA